jgi:tRNA1(Val) A37 N6-methylase TrmN6
MKGHVNHSSETLDALFDGRLTLYQSRAGYRFSLDALLLAHFVTVKPGDKIVDLGTGNGVIPLALADLYASVSVAGVELQAAMVERARRNIELNRLDARIEILRGDVRRSSQIAAAASFDVAVCNPPYRKPTSGRLSANDERQIARHEMKGELGDFLRAANFLLRANGCMALVYSPVRLTDLLTAMREVHIEPKRLRMVHSFPGASASLILVEGVKGGRSGLNVLEPMTVYQRPNEYSEEVADVIAGARKWSVGSKPKPQFDDARK